MSYQYVLRLKAFEEYNEIFPNVFSSDRFSRVLGAFHLGKKKNNPHWHFCITCDWTNVPALRAHLNKHFTLAKGNTHISLKDWDGSAKACSYLFHEECTDPVIQKGYTEDEVLEFQQQNHEIQEKMLKPLQVVEKVVHDMQEKYGIKRAAYDKREIFDRVIQIYRAHSAWLPEQRQCLRLINKIRSDLAQNDDQERFLLNTLYKEYFPFD